MHVTVTLLAASSSLQSAVACRGDTVLRLPLQLQACNTNTTILLLLTHATGKLGRLYQMIDMRLACFNKFLDLSGRLDIVLSNVPAAQAGAEVHARPSNVYVESDESDDDSDDDADSDNNNSDNNDDNDNDDNVDGDSDTG
jgi:hypothetical protein